MNKIKDITLVIISIIVFYLLIDKFMGVASKKIGVVQMDKLVYDFKGMKEATNKYSQKMKDWNTQNDSMENKLKDMYNQIRIDSVSNNKQKLSEDIQKFMIFKQSYMEYRDNVQANAQKEDQEMTLGVVNQVNEYIKAFAAENGFDVILCNNTQYQNVGYWKEKIDVTQQLLEYSNKKYEGVK